PGAMQRVALAKRCFADPGPRFLLIASNRDPGSAAHRFARATRCAASGERNRLLIQPYFLEPQVVVLAVIVRLEIPDIGLPAIACRAEQHDRTRRVVDKNALDVPDDLFAFLLVQFARLRGA